MYFPMIVRGRVGVLCVAFVLSCFVLENLMKSLKMSIVEFFSPLCRWAETAQEMEIPSKKPAQIGFPHGFGRCSNDERTYKFTHTHTHQLVHLLC